MAIIDNKQGAFKHIAHYGLKQVIADIAREKTDIAHLQVIFDREQKAKIHNANTNKTGAGLTYVALAKVGSLEGGKNFDFDNQKLTLAIAKVVASKKYGVDFINGYLVVSGTTIPPARPSIEPIKAANFSFEPIKTKHAPEQPEVAPEQPEENQPEFTPEQPEEKQDEIEQEKPKKNAKK